MKRALHGALRATLAATGRAEALIIGAGAPRPARRIDPAPRRIVVWTMDRIGDVQRASGLFRMVKAHWPACEIVAVVAGRSMPILRENPHITAIHCVPSPYDLRTHAGVLRRLRADHFDLGILAEVDPFWAKLGHWSMRALGVPQWVGFDLGHALPRQCRAVPLDHARSWTDQFVAMAESLGVPDDGQGLDLHLSPDERRAARDTLAQHGIADGQDFVLVHPGGNFLTVSRQWPAERFGAMLDLVGERWNLPFVLTGLPAERPTIDTVKAATRMPVVDLCGRLGLRELAAVIARSAVCVSNDTGPLHIAHALRKPAVVVLGPTAPAVVGLPATTLPVFADLPCRPCAFLQGWQACTNPSRWACLSRIEPEAVAMAVSTQLGRVLPGVEGMRRNG